MSKVFGFLCVMHRIGILQEDYRLDYGVAEACEPDVVTFCSAEKGLAHGNAEVLKCLVKVRLLFTCQALSLFKRPEISKRS
jgi:hypothetical protein